MSNIFEDAPYRTCDQIFLPLSKLTTPSSPIHTGVSDFVSLAAKPASVTPTMHPWSSTGFPLSVSSRLLLNYYGRGRIFQALSNPNLSFCFRREAAKGEKFLALPTPACYKKSWNSQELYKFRQTHAAHSRADPRSRRE